MKTCYHSIVRNAKMETYSLAYQTSISGKLYFYSKFPLTGDREVVSWLSKSILILSSVSEPGNSADIHNIKMKPKSQASKLRGEHYALRRPFIPH